MSHILPTDYVDSTYDIDFQKLYDQGYRLALFDVDNTLVPHGAPADQRSTELFRKMKKMGFRFMFLSNNKEPRVKSFSDAVGGDGYTYKSGKPNPSAYLEAMERMQVDKEHTIFIGDQILTDVLGANKAGIRSVLVKPVLKWHEEPQIVLKRFLEYIILLPYVFGKSRGTCPLRDRTK